MTPLSREQATSRERTLLAALLLSTWGPLATGIALVLGRSSTQLADFIRRSVELVALFVSWWVFRHLQRQSELSQAEREDFERLTGLSVAGALLFSGVVLFTVAMSRVGGLAPGGNVYLGLGIAVLGLLTNGWFWHRYTRLNREHFSTIIHAQARLYRAKACVDLCVVSALAALAIAPTVPVTQYIDRLGSVAVAGYLLWCGVRMARENWKGPRRSMLSWLGGVGGQER